MKLKNLFTIALFFTSFFVIGQNIHWTEVQMKDVSTAYDVTDSLLVITPDGTVKSRPVSSIEGQASSAINYNYTTAEGVGDIRKEGQTFIHDYTGASNVGANPWYRNTFVGINAGNYTNGTGAGQGWVNTGIGNYALNAISTGIENTAVGGETLGLTSTGSNNTAVGGSALYSNTTGDRNTALGRQAGVWLTTGSNNTFLGSTAGFTQVAGGNLTNIEQSVIIGSYADGTQGSSNEITIGYYAEGKGSNTVSIGNADITDTYLRGFVHVEDGIEINSKPFIHQTTGSANAPTNDWTLNTFIGTYAGNYTNGGTGYLGSLNVGIGAWALNGLTTGQQNNMIGNEAGAQISSGMYNNGIGDAILYSLTSGSDNIAIGKNCLQNITTSNENVAIGRNAGYFIGGATSNMTSATAGVYIGKDARASTNGNVNEVVIGVSGRGNGSNTTTLGGNGNTDTYIKGTIHTEIQTAPASASASGEAGEIIVTADYIYICTAADTWKRVAVASW